MHQKPRVAIVACEESGDYLGAALIKELKHFYPNASFLGVGGVAMRKQGLKSLYKLEELTAHGIVEIIHRIPKLLNIRNSLAKQIVTHKADIFIGIDAPDFNIKLEERIRHQGIKAVHYISPTVWAWRPNRVFSLAKAVDLLLCVYPFEVEIYKKFYKEKNVSVKATYIGHPLADEIPLKSNKKIARKKLQLEPAKNKYIAVLPGSRFSEIKRLSDIFVCACLKFLEKNEHTHFIFAAINNNAAQHIRQTLNKNNFPAGKQSIFIRKGREIIAAADAVLLASGTASLETMLIKRPMVIAYKLPTLTYWILNNLITSKYISHPNFLFNKAIIPEFVQNQVTPSNIAKSLHEQLSCNFSDTEKQFTSMHKKLKRNASLNAAKLVAKLLSEYN